MNPDDLKAVQRAGWAIAGVDEQTVTAKCPTHGCGMMARFKVGGTIPRRDVGATRFDTVVTCFDDAREVLKSRRQELGLTIPEVEHISGIAGDHLAKFEKTDFSRIPNIETLMSWTAALGYEVVLRHGELPAVTLRWIADTRPKIEARRRRFEIERKRDPQLRQRQDPLEAERARLIRQQEFIAAQIADISQQIEDRGQGDLFGEFESD